MPQDVDIGAGYCGDALFQRFPGQYRNPEMDQAERQHFNAFPGNHGPQYTDPDSGRKMVLKELPGIGQVVVPVDHTMAQVVNVEHNMAAVYPVDHTMVGLGTADPRSSQGQMGWHAKLVSALDASANMASAPAQLSTAFNTVAQCAVQCALELSQKGHFKTPDDAVAYVKAAIISSAKAFKPMVQKVAAGVAASTAVAVAPILKKAWTARKPLQKKTGRMARTMGDWPGSMMGVGQLTASIVNLTAGSDLDQLASSISKLLDATTNAFNTLGDLKAQEAAAQAVAPQVGPPAPDDQLYVQYAQAMTAINQGYAALTGFDYLSTILMKVFGPNADKLRTVYSGIDGLMVQLQNWDSTWQSQVAATHPDQSALWDQIQNLHNQLYGGATGGKALNTDDPAYLQTAAQAVQQLTGVSPDQSGMSGMGDFGITALIAIIVICVAAVAVTIAVAKLAGQFNAVANNISAQRQQYNATMASQHDTFVANEISQGKSAVDAENDWLAYKTKADAQETAQEQQYGQNAPSAASGMTQVLTYALAGVAGIIVLPHILKAVGL